MTVLAALEGAGRALAPFSFAVASLSLVVSALAYRLHRRKYLTDLPYVTVIRGSETLHWSLDGPGSDGWRVDRVDIRGAVFSVGSIGDDGYSGGVFLRDINQQDNPRSIHRPERCLYVERPPSGMVTLIFHIGSKALASAKAKREVSVTMSEGAD